MTQYRVVVVYVTASGESHERWHIRDADTPLDAIRQVVNSKKKYQKLDKHIENHVTKITVEEVS